MAIDMDPSGSIILHQLEATEVQYRDAEHTWEINPWNRVGKSVGWDGHTRIWDTFMAAVGPNFLVVCIDEKPMPRMGEGHWLFEVGECDARYDKNDSEVAPLSRLEYGQKAMDNWCRQPCDHQSWETTTTVPVGAVLISWVDAGGDRKHCEVLKLDTWSNSLRHRWYVISWGVRCVAWDDLRRVVDAPVKEPGCIGEVKDGEVGRCELVSGDWGGDA